jgi:hypothetical protein
VLACALPTIPRRSVILDAEFVAEDWFEVLHRLVGQCRPIPGQAGPIRAVGALRDHAEYHSAILYRPSSLLLSMPRMAGIGVRPGPGRPTLFRSPDRTPRAQTRLDRFDLLILDDFEPLGHLFAPDGHRPRCSGKIASGCPIQDTKRTPPYGGIPWQDRTIP